MSENTVTRSMLEPKSYNQLADDLIEKAGITTHKQAAEVLRQMASTYFYDLRRGNKREERAACDFLNLLQREAAKVIREEKEAQP